VSHHDAQCYIDIVKISSRDSKGYKLRVITSDLCQTSAYRVMELQLTVNYYWLLLIKHANSFTTKTFYFTVKAIDIEQRGQLQFDGCPACHICSIHALRISHLWAKVHHFLKKCREPFAVEKIYLSTRRFIPWGYSCLSRDIVVNPPRDLRSLWARVQLILE